MSLLNFGLPTSFFERRILFSDFCCLFRKIPLKNRGGRCFFVLRENGDALLCVKTFSTYVIFGHRRESYAFGFSGI